MNADSAFAIGKRHEVCQDYALFCSDGKLAFACVSDGCSSSRDSDIGARLISLAAKESYPEALKWSAEEFGLVTVSKAGMIAEMMHLERESLDATLLYVMSDSEHVNIASFGDGVIFLQHSNGHIGLFDIEYKNGYPDYLSYKIDETRSKKYNKIWKDGCGIVKCSYGDEITEFHIGLHKPYSLSISTEPFLFAAVLSDGVRSFYKRNESGASEPIPLTQVLESLMDFKLYSGHFVQRRLNRFLKDAAQKGWEHYDDIAMAAIHFGE